MNFFVRHMDLPFGRALYESPLQQYCDVFVNPLDVSRQTTSEPTQANLAERLQTFDKFPSLWREHGEQSPWGFEFECIGVGFTVVPGLNESLSHSQRKISTVRPKSLPYRWRHGS